MGMGRGGNWGVMVVALGMGSEWEAVKGVWINGTERGSMFIVSYLVLIIKPFR